MPDLRTRLFDHLLPSPLILASGPRSCDAEGIQLVFEAGAGAVVTKTLRTHPAENPIPHIARPRGRGLSTTLFNCEQWADLSWERWVEHEIPSLKDLPGALIVSIGHSAEEVETVLPPVLATGVGDIIECVAYGQEQLPPLVAAVSQLTDLPILAKLSFNWGDDLLPTAEAALKAGANGITAIDSIGPTLAIDIETAQPILGGAGGKGWMSGAAIKPVSVAVVADLAERFKCPIVATGGVVSGEDVIEMTMVGATAVAACTAPLLRGLEWFGKTEAAVQEWLEDHGFDSLDQIRGKALSRLPTTDLTQPLEFRLNLEQCNYCGLCSIACPYQARQVEAPTSDEGSGQVLWHEERCRFCGLCVEVCHRGALTARNWSPSV